MTHDPATCMACSRDMHGLRCEHCGSPSRMVDAHPDLVPRGLFMVEPWRRPVVVDRTLFSSVKKGRPSNAERARREAERKAVN